MIRFPAQQRANRRSDKTARRMTNPRVLSTNGTLIIICKNGVGHVINVFFNYLTLQLMRNHSQCAETMLQLRRLSAILAALALFTICASAQSWSLLSPTGTTPTARGFQGTTGVYDPASNRMIVFGGRDTNGNNLNDVWVLTDANGIGGASQWINLIANGDASSPPARSGHSAVYDAADNIMIVFGGCGGSCSPALNDVWVLANANGLGGTPAWT